MVNYTTNLREWGAAGAEYPVGYKYEDGVAPVDDWDNFLMDNIINDIQSLIDTTNTRIESDYGTEFPTAEEAHLFSNTATGELYWFDSDNLSWSKTLDKKGDTMEGKLTIDSEIELDSDMTDGDTTVYNQNTSNINNDLIPKNNLEAEFADTANVGLRFESRTDYPSNPQGGRIVYRSDK